MPPRSVHSSGVRIEYDDAGSGEPALLCIHAWCSGREAFEPFLRHAAASRRVLAVDLRGHGGSATGDRDFGLPELVEDVLAVVEASGLDRFVPVTLSHGGWVAHALRERLGARVPGMVIVNWLVFTPPEGFMESLQELRDPERWLEARQALNTGWLRNAPAEVREREMAVKERYGFEMNSRAAREIGGAFEREGSPLEALGRMADPPPVLFLHAPLGVAEYRFALDGFAREHPWFTARELRTGTYVPTCDAPAETAEMVEEFLGRL